MDKLEKSLQQYDKSIEKSYPIIPGEIGIPLGGNRVTEVAGRGQFVYVRLRSNTSEIIQAFNGKVFPGYGIPVLVQWHNNRYEIIGVDVQRYQQWLADNPHIAKHGATHSMDKEGDRLGTDPVWVYPYQFMPFLVSPFPQSNIQNVYVNPTSIFSNGTWKYMGNTGTQSLAPYKPTSGSSIVFVSFDAITGNPYLLSTTGTYIPSSVTGTLDLLGYLPSIDQSRYIPLSFILMNSGTTNITWDNLYDVRQFVSFIGTGSSYLKVNNAYPINQIVTSGATFSSSGTVGFFEFSGGAISTTGSTYPIIFHIAGGLETGTSMSQPYLVQDTFLAGYAYLYLENLGTTGTTLVDIKKNGVSIFTGTTPLSIPFNSTGSWVRGIPFYASYVRGDILKVDILTKATSSQNAVVGISSILSSANGSITVEESDGAPSISSVAKLIFSNSIVTNLGAGNVGILPVPNIKSVGSLPSGSKTTTSSSYANIDSSRFDITFTKLDATTDILIDLSMSLYATAQPTRVGLGVLENSIDYDVVTMDINAASTHFEVRGVKRISGLSAGSHTFTPRWKRVSGGGTITFDQANGAMLFMTVQEVQA